MHTANCGKVRFHYSSDLSGNVIIQLVDNELEVPGKALLDFIGGWVAARRISQLEYMEPQDVLGIPKEDQL